MKSRMKFFIVFLLLFFLPLFSMDLKKFLEDVKGIQDNVLYFTSLDGTKLAYRVVSPPSPKAILIFVHGITSYGKYYLPFAYKLSEKGIKVYLPDVRGHGNSQGKRGDSPNTATIVQDMGLFYQMVLKENPPIPIFLGGHSMGASLTVKYVHELKLSPSGLVLVAGGLPVSRISSKSEKLLRLKTLSRTFQFIAPIFPHMRIISFEFPIKVDDPLIVSNYSYAFFRAVFPTDMDHIWEGLELPILAIIGDKDEFFGKEDVEQAFLKHKKDNRVFVMLEDTDHLDVLEKSVKYIIEWILREENGL
ncbi:MAG: alpha/beta hydrolase [Dictyoglomus sp. NZ13-RE01]|nr:MAG: alpha/beta hydrolase [Dictyoglomus sp. NZ13-RE01]